MLILWLFATALLGNIALLVFGWKVRSTENRILSQMLPVIFYILFVRVFMPISFFLIPLNVDTPFIISVMVMVNVFPVASTLFLSISGVVEGVRTQNRVLMLLSSLTIVSLLIFTYTYYAMYSTLLPFLVYGFVVLFILMRKGVRKLQMRGKEVEADTVE